MVRPSVSCVGMSLDYWGPLLPTVMTAERWGLAEQLAVGISKCICSATHDARLLQLHHIGCNGISNHQPYDCLLNHLFRHRSKKTSKLRVTGLCVGDSPVTGDFPAQMASNAKNVAIWWRHHVMQECVDELNYHWCRQWLVTWGAVQYSISVWNSS